MDNFNGKTPHILNTAATILGICAVLITGIKFLNIGNSTLLDEILLTTAIFMFFSVVLSYLSIRGNKGKQKYEEWADYIFLLVCFCSLFQWF